MRSILMRSIVRVGIGILFVFAFLLLPLLVITAFGVQAAHQLDLNTATTEKLKTLPGIGQVYATKIIRGRPYTRTDELVQKKIIPLATYNRIKDQIVAGQE